MLLIEERRKHTQKEIGPLLSISYRPLRIQYDLKKPYIALTIKVFLL